MALRKERPPSGRSNANDRPMTSAGANMAANGTLRVASGSSPRLPPSSSRPATGSGTRATQAALSARKDMTETTNAILSRPNSSRGNPQGNPLASPLGQARSSPRLFDNSSGGGPESNSPVGSARSNAVRELNLQRAQSRSLSARSGFQSGRSEQGELTSEEVMRRLTEKAHDAERAKERELLAELPEYNEYSRPRPSREFPLRTVLLDPKVNNIPKSHTRSEFLRKVKYGADPHPSYDVDGDGWVSQEDYGIAKRFDLNGNGVLDPSEREIAKRILADEFFKKHENDLHLFGEKFVGKPHSKNVDWLVNSYSFERTYNRLKSTERTLVASTSKKIADGMSLADDSLTRYNYYTNKFDTTAWNDFDGIPRSVTAYAPKQSSVGVMTHDSMPSSALFSTVEPKSTSNWTKATAAHNIFGENDNHGGSRQRLLFTRRQRVIEGNQMKLDAADFKNGPAMNNRRMNLITNVEIENGR